MKRRFLSALLALSTASVTIASGKLILWDKQKKVWAKFEA